MPYRRLPNTDAARIRAMRMALEKGKEVPPHKLAYSAKILVNLRKFLPLFEHSLQLLRQTIATQNKKSKKHYDISRKARIYMTHFIRVMNMAIYRGELPAETRAYYGLPIDESASPSLNTENELLSWGRRIIEGEEIRIRKGGSPITNPTIAVVKVWFEQYIDALNYNNTLNRKTQEFVEKNNALRKEADEIILHIWNEVEASFENLTDEERRNRCNEYGLVYFFRKGEIVDVEEERIQNPAM